MPIVLGYHGCDIGTAHALLGGSAFQASKRDYDWLGTGIYFWESDVVRAFQWASDPRRRFSNPSVVGAVIELGHCLDLITQPGIQAVRVAYDQFIKTAQKTQVPIPENVDPAAAPQGDRVIRRLDCAVMNYLFEISDIARQADPRLLPHDTVRALFPEGNELYPGAGFMDKTHVQICVRSPRRILGVFRVPEWQRAELGLPELS